MPLYYDDDQTMLADTAGQFMAEEGSIKNQLRHWRDRDCKDGFGHGLWQQFAEMGFTGILVDEDDGGLGMGQVEANIVLEEIGRNLTPSPFLSSSVLAATALKHGSNDVKGRWLPSLLSGEKVYGVAIDEGRKHRPETIGCKAEKSGNGFKLSAKTDLVVYGARSEMIVVAARTSGSDSDRDGVTLFAV
ncbi:MAG: acyl-CoA dehydrogenase family protein, partial [Pseudomonadota bacterium]|nr:acyl-CoA dehydrogenase family protein [Pseudomonadota bacterium]